MGGNMKKIKIPYLSLFFVFTYILVLFAQSDTIKAAEVQGGQNTQSMLSTQSTQVIQSTQNTVDISGLEFKATAKSENRIDLSWNTIAGAGSYKIERSTSLNGTYRELVKVYAGTVTYSDTNVKTGKMYYYRITVMDMNSNSISSTMPIIRSATLVSTEIRNIKVVNENAIRFYWSTAKKTDGYVIYRAMKKKGEFVEIARVENAAGASYTDTTIVPGQNYYYKIRGYANIDGNLNYSSSSNVLLGRSVASVNLISITSKSSGKIAIKWDQAKGATSYLIYRSTKSDSGYKKIAEVSGSKQLYTDNTVKSGKQYYYRIISCTVVSGKTIKSSHSTTITAHTLKQTKMKYVKLTEDNALKVKWYEVKDAEYYKIYRATSENGNYKQIAIVEAPSVFYIDSSVKAERTYYYKVRAYDMADGLLTNGRGDTSKYKSGKTMYAIMGRAQVSVAQMVKLYQASGRTYPSSIYASKGASTIEEFCQIVLEESEAEGVRAEVIFAQICLETGYLSFGYQVSAEQCNFAGLGATDDGAAGATFADVRTGIRAQVQHMKGYASTEPLNNICVDPRFSLLGSRRGSAPYVEKLGNGNWATDPLYAPKLKLLIQRMRKY